MSERKVRAMKLLKRSKRVPREGEKNWRIMGLGVTGAEFLIVMGTSREECEGLFADALSEYSYAELKEIDSAWIEEWIYDDYFERSAWLPHVELPLRRLRLRAAALQQHATRRSA